MIVISWIGKTFNTEDTGVHGELLKLFQLGQHGFHFGLGVEVAGAAGGGDAIGQHGFRVGNSVGLG